MVTKTIWTKIQKTRSGKFGVFFGTADLPDATAFLLAGRAALSRGMIVLPSLFRAASVGSCWPLTMTFFSFTTSVLAADRMPW
jgi:hypothetical protein